MPHPKEKSSTPSSPFASNKLDTPIQFLKGVGPRLARSFESRNIKTIRDLLYFFPRTYEDRTETRSLSQIESGQKITLKLRALSKVFKPLRGKFSKLFEVRAADEKGNTVTLKWFRTYKGFDERFSLGTLFYATGKLETRGALRDMIHPEIEFNLERDVHVDRIVPIYVEIDGISTKVLRGLIATALQIAEKNLEEELPLQLINQYSFPQLLPSLQHIHFPKDEDLVELEKFRTPAHLRLIYEEFFKFEYQVLQRRLNLTQENGRAFDSSKIEKFWNSAVKQLPFELTRGQKDACQAILKDLSSDTPMNRLLQGDVGAGKTAVALSTAYAVMQFGSQVAFMAPTEILAEQHVSGAKRIFGPHFPVFLLVGKTTTRERKEIQLHLDSGAPCLLIGTHALIEDPVQFKSLELVIIDEQHRFGVEQRKKLRTKSRLPAHQLLMTATPIPRTLALTAYGDLEVSTISERPPGRTPIKTHLVRAADHAKMVAFIHNQLAQGRQAYFIYPLVEASEAEEFQHLKNAVAEAERLKAQDFPEYTVGLLHGKMSSVEKATVMERFRSGVIHLLVSTTVVEVGVDVPNATVMVIEDAERFGLSQLHQLRGRIGRGQHASTCFLKTSRPSFMPTPERLEVLVSTEDGFEIAQADLELRGPGEFLGTRQSGDLAFKLASLTRDQDWLIRAREDAIALLESDPSLERPEHRPFRQYLARLGGAGTALQS